jgi:hypothetical protein
MRPSVLSCALLLLACVLSSWLMPRALSITVDIIGERNCGTNWLSSVIAKNVGKNNLLSLTNSPSNAKGMYKRYPGLYHSKFGWKHGFLRRDLISDASLGAASNVFVVIFRNPYSWLMSMQRMPHHAPKVGSLLPAPLCVYISHIPSPLTILYPIQHMRLPLGKFVRKEWHCFGRGEDEFMFERSPDDQSAFANVIQMRTRKYKDWLDLQNLVDRVVYVSYERVLEDEGKAMVDAIVSRSTEQLHLPSGGFTAEYGRCGAFGWRNGCSQGRDSPARQEKIRAAVDEDFMSKLYADRDTLAFINSQLDQEMEENLGYRVHSEAHQSHDHRLNFHPERYSTASLAAHGPDAFSSGEQHMRLRKLQRKLKQLPIVH